jgi:hypothetical protein
MDLPFDEDQAAPSKRVRMTVVLILQPPDRSWKTLLL